MPRRTALWIIALALIYAAAARLGLSLHAVERFATLVWPSSGIALSALLLGGARLWPGVLLGAFAVNFWLGAPPAVALAIAAGNTLEAVIGAVALRRLKLHVTLDRVRDVAALVFAAAMGSTLVSATAGVVSLYLAGMMPAARMATAWRTWWIGDMIGDLIIVPLVLAWATKAEPRDDDRGRTIGTAALFALALLVAVFVFVLPLPAALLPLRQPFLLFPALAWAPLRLGLRGVATTTFVVSVLAIGGHALGVGPFITSAPAEGLTELQVFMAAMAMGLLVLGALVTERRRVQTALEGAVSARDEFLSIASHELRTPLAAVVLQLDMLRRSASKLLAGDTTAGGSLEAQLKKALRQTDRLTFLLDNLLEVSRMSSGKLRLDREPLDLAALVRDVVGRFAEAAEKAGCQLEVTTEEATGEWDRLRIEQVVTNLLSNAIKFGPGKPVVVAVGGDAMNATLSVRDHGIGISAEDVERVFGRFERAVAARHIGGLGLGLFIARRLLEAHGGTIRVESSPDKGSAFFVELPRNSPLPSSAG